MKKKVFLVLSLFLIGLIGFYQSNGFAETIEKTIKVTANSIKLFVNGRSIDGDNFVYNDTTYIPLRQVAESMGKQVTWDENTQTVEIKDVQGDSVKANSSNSRYVGETKRDGQGIYTWPNGDTYNGQWKQGKMEGQGTLRYHGGEQYTGSFSNNKRDGSGTMKWANNEQYEGNWEKDFMSGEGTYTFANGDVYEGNWQSGKMQGLGTYSIRNGEDLEGTWHENKLIASQK